MEIIGFLLFCSMFMLGGVMFIYVRFFGGVLILWWW